MKTLTVELGDRSYPIIIGEGLIADTELLRSRICQRQLFVVTNERVAPLYLAQLEQAFSDRQLRVVTLPDGEREKTLANFSKLLDELIDARFNRDAAAIALGGGVVGDITGFVAASYQRGIDFIQVPTTLLAQVDSSVGGKTAVNHPVAKNMIGAFHQPRLVIADTATLKTLPDRELRAGLAEVVKYGLIMDSEFFAWLQENAAALLARHPEALAHAIAVSCRSKAKIVAADEREQGQRALLNLGHTFGHAIEALSGYGMVLHGEAVAMGMILAARMSVAQGLLAAEQVEPIETLLTQLGLPVAPPPLAPDALLERMLLDKKVSEGQLRLVLLDAIGAARLMPVDPRAVTALLSGDR